MRAAARASAGDGDAPGRGEADGEVGADAAKTYVAKAYHDGAKATAVAREGRALHALGLPPPLVLAPVVAHLTDLAVVVQGHLDGRVNVTG